MNNQPMSFGAPRLGLMAVVVFLHSACGIVLEEEVYEIEFVSGDGQIQGRERQLNEPVVVQAVDEDGHPAPGVELSFSTDPPSGSVDFNSVTTDSIGRAAVWWTLGDLVGRQILTVRSQSLGAAISATARESDFDIHLVTDPGLYAGTGGGHAGRNGAVDRCHHGRYAGFPLVAGLPAPQSMPGREDADIRVDRRHANRSQDSDGSGQSDGPGLL